MTDQYGPNTAAVAAFLALLPSVTSDEWEQVDTAREAELCSVRAVAWGAALRSAEGSGRGAARDAAWDAAWDTDWSATPFFGRDFAWDATWKTAWDASLALVVRDLITPEHYTILTAPFAGIDRFAAALNTPGGAA